jgi:quinol monooxygenase YgiN
VTCEIQISKPQAPSLKHQTLYCIQNQEDPEVVLIVEQWDSRQHYERYLAWRAERGDMEIFGAMMAGPPNIRFFDYFRV